jgi:phage baseplate assembly protein gpV
MSIEGYRNQQHREALRVVARITRRVPCLVASYDGDQHRVKVQRQPEGTLTGWLQIQTAQIGLMIAPNIGDPGWLEFHDGDPRAAVFVGSNHNDLNPPPIAIQAGEAYYQNKFGFSLYVKADGSATATDKAGTTFELDGAGNATVTATTAVTVHAPTINLGNGGVLQPVKLADNSPSTVLKAQ